MTRATHKDLWCAVHTDARDYRPYGVENREGADCSCGCWYYHRLRGKRGADWGVCVNPLSHRNGLLTFEHQGCANFAYARAAPTTRGTDGSND